MGGSEDQWGGDLGIQRMHIEFRIEFQKKTQ